MTASMTPLPVIGVPVPLEHLSGLDSLLSIVQMPAGIPVATVAIGNARNAGLLAVRILGAYDAELRGRLQRFADTLADAVKEKDERTREQFRSLTPRRGDAPPCGPGLYAESTPDKPAYVMAGVGRGRDVPRARRALEPARAAVRRRPVSASGTTSRSAWRTTRATSRWRGPRNVRGSTSRPINYHFNADEIAYILDDCDAQGVRDLDVPRRHRSPSSTTKMPAAVETRLLLVPAAVTVDGYDSYEDAVATFPAEPIAEELEGHAMMYSSGTTGRPEGHPVHARTRAGRGSLAVPRRLREDLRRRRELRVPVARAAVPLRAAAVLHRRHAPRRHVRRSSSTSTPRARSRPSSKYKVTHAQWVPTMFVRMLKLPEEVRAQVRRLVDAARDPRRRAVPGADQGTDDRVVGPDHVRVLRRDRGHGLDDDHERGVARAPRLGRPCVQHDDPHPRRGGQRAADRRGRRRLLRGRPTRR